MTPAVLGMLAVVAGVSTIFWIYSAPVVFLDGSPASLWESVNTVLVAASMLGCWLGILTAAPRTHSRVWWVAFSLLGGPFGPACFWINGWREPSSVRPRNRIGALIISAVLLLFVLGVSSPLAPLLGARSSLAVLSTVGLLSITLWTRGNRFWPIWACLVLLIVALNVLPAWGL
jgi:hypothetical protein